MSRTCVVPAPTLHRIIGGATRAPSVRNTQPWRWRASPDGLELFADRSRRLPATDPDGRNMVISCGAALHHAQVVAAAAGWTATVTRRPDPGSPDLLARLQLSPAPPPPGANDLLEAVELRCTDRRRFTSWPVPDERLESLAAVATTWGTIGRALTDVSDRFLAQRLISHAADLQGRSRAVVLEQEDWLEHLPDTDLEGQDLQIADGLVLLLDDEDAPASWLRAGEGLSSMWLTATSAGLSLVPLSQVIEVARTREALRAGVLRGLGHPLLVVRVGWQMIGRSGLERTPRRPIEEVLEGP